MWGREREKRKVSPYGAVVPILSIFLSCALFFYGMQKKSAESMHLTYVTQPLVARTK